jgi:acetyl-CoA C-acetyltransferase
MPVSSSQNRGQTPVSQKPGSVPYLPNTPVLVGVAAVQQRIEEAGVGLEPVELMIAALQQAAEDAGSIELLRRADRIEVPKGLWNYTDPARLVADAIGAEQAHTVLAEIGILQQTMINRACNSIASGECSIVLVTGAEAKYRALRGQIAGLEIAETAQQDIAPDTTLQPAAELWSTVESDAGLAMPVGFYAILDSALRASQGLSVSEHRDQMAAMYAGFSTIAAANEDAWVREPVDAAFIREHSPRNKMLAFPYTKLHNSQWNVDQGAGLIFCSAAVAEQLDIARERWVFPLAGTESNAMSVVTARRDLHRCHGFHEAGREVLTLAGKLPADIDLMELYSCFPLAVRAQLQELGLSHDQPLSVTGAMTFGGGPLNNFVLQATVKMARLLRGQAGATGLVTCVSGMNTKQGCALYSTLSNPAGWQFADVTTAVEDATGLCELVSAYEGAANIAGYTVLYQGEAPWRAVAVCDLPGGRRTVVFSEEAAVIAAMLIDEFVGRAVQVFGGKFTLAE